MSDWLWVVLLVVAGLGCGLGLPILWPRGAQLLLFFRILGAILLVGAATLAILALISRDEEPAPQPTPTPAPTDTPPPTETLPPISMALPLRELLYQIGVTDAQLSGVPESAIQEDDEGDHFYWNDGQPVAGGDPVSDIHNVLSAWFDVAYAAADRLNDELDCDREGIHCSAGGPIEPGRYALIAMQFYGDLATPPVCPRIPCQYNWGIANLENYPPETQYDILGGTRWWYQFVDYGQGWQFWRIDSATGIEVETTEARVIAVGPVLACLIPEGEIPGAEAFRPSAFFFDYADVPGDVPNLPIEIHPGVLTIDR